MKHLLKKIMPKSIKKDLELHYDKNFKRKHKSLYTSIENKNSRFSLSAKHIQNLQPLVDRFALLKQLPKNAIVTEIGVDKGDFSEAILAYTKPQKLHLVDLWGTERYHQGKRVAVEKKFVAEISEGRVQLNLGLSTEVVHTFTDAYFDWIYIDTDHSYKNTLSELKLYSAKVKPGGIIAGHDFVIGNWKGLVKYGVIDAVYEFCVTENWELIYLTMEHPEHPSFAIRKIALDL